MRFFNKKRQNNMINEEFKIEEDKEKPHNIAFQGDALSYNEKECNDIKIGYKTNIDFSKLEKFNDLYLGDNATLGKGDSTAKFQELQECGDIFMTSGSKLDCHDCDDLEKVGNLICFHCSEPDIIIDPIDDLTHGTIIFQAFENDKKSFSIPNVFKEEHIEEFSIGNDVYYFIPSNDKTKSTQQLISEGENFLDRAYKIQENMQGFKSDSLLKLKDEVAKYYSNIKTKDTKVQKTMENDFCK